MGDLNKIEDGNIGITSIAETKLDEYYYINNQFLNLHNQSIFTGYCRQQKFIPFETFEFIHFKPQKWKMVICFNLQCSISEKQILSLVFDKSVRILLNSV